MSRAPHPLPFSRFDGEKPHRGLWPYHLVETILE
jgi:hypothetical protein